MAEEHADPTKSTEPPAAPIAPGARRPTPDVDYGLPPSPFPEEYHVRLESFEGPLDLLLHLIKKHEMDIYDIPIARITEQYLGYLQAMRDLDLDIAGEFLVMAATLLYIKSRMLLPQEPVDDEEAEEGDPREALIQQLLEYQRFKESSQQLRVMEQKRRDIFVRRSGLSSMAQEDEEELFEASLFDLINAFSRMLAEMPADASYEVALTEVSVEDQMNWILDELNRESALRFSRLRKTMRSRGEVVSTFLAMLELIKQGRVLIVQRGLFGDIEIQQNPNFQPFLAMASARSVGGDGRGSESGDARREEAA